MNDLDKFSESILLFLDNKMDKEEREVFLSEMVQNPELAKEVKTQDLERRAIDVLFEREYKDKISLWQKETVVIEKRLEGKTNIFSIVRGVVLKRPAIRRAAILVLTIFVMSIVYLWVSSYSNSSIVSARYYDPIHTLEPVRFKSGDSNHENFNEHSQVFDLAKSSFVLSRYDKAIEYLNILPKDKPSVKYLLAHCFFAKGEYSFAIRTFEDIVKDNEAYFFEAKTYLMYAYVANGMAGEDKLDMLLNEIMSSSSNYPKVVREKAEAIQADLNSIGRKVYEVFI